MAMPPLYKIGKGKSSKYIYTQDEMNEFLNTEEGKKKLSIQRYKGLGEMNADQLWETTLDPESRYLKKIGIVDAKEAEETFEMLMGDKVAPRKEFIIKNSKFVKDLDI